MDILNNPYVGLAFLAILIVGIVLVCQKDTLSQSKKGTRELGWVFISVSAVAILYRIYLLFLVQGSKYVYGRVRNSLQGGSRCIDQYSDPNCTVKRINYSTLEKFLSVVGLDVVAQSWAKSRVLSKGI
jgi:hypothetical protein